MRNRPQCDWCGLPTVWIVSLGHRGTRAVCQQHYDQVERDKKADRIQSYADTRNFQALRIQFTHASQ